MSHFSRLLSFFLSALAFPSVFAQSSMSSTATSPAPVSASTTSTPALTSNPISSNTPSGTSTGSTTSASNPSSSEPPDVFLNVPQLSVGRIELDVDNLQADLNLNAQVASLVNINAGVSVSVQKVNITIADVDAQLELTVRLGHLVDIVNRTFQSLDLNPLLISTLDNVTSALDDVVGEVDGLLGSITQSGTTLSFVIDNLGNIVQQVPGASGGLVSTIVGDYLTNMTFTGQQQTLSGGLVQKTYSYAPLSTMVNIVFNTLGQVVQATVANSAGGGSTSSSALPSATGVKKRKS